VIPGVILLQVSAFNLPAFYAYIAGASDRAKRATNFGITWASFPLGLVFSPIVGSVLLNLISVRQIFLFTFVFFTVSTIILFFMKSQPPLRKNPQTPKLEVPRSRREGMLLPLSRGSCTRIQYHNTLHTSVLPRCRRTAPINHSIARSGTVPRSDSLRDPSRKKSGFSWEGQRNSPRTNGVSDRSLRGSACQKPISGLSNRIPRWRRTSAKPSCLFYVINRQAGRVKGWTVRILP